MDDDYEGGRLASLVARINGLLASRADVLLAVAVIAVLGLLIFRIPPAMMDVLLAVNIAISALVLLLALYTQEITKFPSFPTIILLTTLFRLALNVSTTRLILLEAHGGKIIQAFGDFVVGGNLVVGAVVFILLVIVQFVVVAKGSERVAEVGARFTLDALPGKQMAIDRDQERGDIEAEEATRRRDELSRESKLYGAMEGAMKFVKGDAIAGIIISAVNVAAGIIIGVTQFGMSAGESAETFSLLTIGDGLVSQIPSIIICVSAGLVVTRVVSDRKASAASDMVKVVTSNPRAIAILGVLLLVLAWVPGFPTVVFLVLAAAVGGLWWFNRGGPSDEDDEFGDIDVAPARASGRNQSAAADSSTGGPGSRPSEPMRTTEGQFGSPEEVGICLGVDLSQWIASAPEIERTLTTALSRQIAAVGADVGVGQLRLMVDTAMQRQLPRRGYGIVLRGTVAAIGELDVSRVFVQVPVKTALDSGLDAEIAELPWRALPGCSIPAAQVDALNRVGLRGIGAIEFIVRHVDHVIRSNAHLYLTVDLIGKHLEALDDSDLRKAVNPDPLKISEIAVIFQNLLRDGFPVADFRLVLEAIAKVAPSRKGKLDEIYGLVREELAGAMCRKLLLRRAEPGAILPVYRLEPRLVEMLSAEQRAIPGGGVQAFITNPRVANLLTLSILSSIDPARGVTEDPVLVTSPNLRAMLCREMHHRIPQLTVMSSSEIRGAFTIQESPVVLCEE